ncbi:MAG TPA: hypothetical protein VMA77_17135 [Solirubrobacteraceae bacterium]|nr:hypothetical protein [Solirubrobacteraceae bacterium]
MRSHRHHNRTEKSPPRRGGGGQVHRNSRQASRRSEAPVAGERQAGSHELTAARVASVEEPDLERQGRVLGASGWRFLVLGVVMALPGIALLVFTDGVAMGIGIAVVALAGCPAVVGAGLLLSSLVARRSARHKLFA